MIWGPASSAGFEFDGREEGMVAMVISTAPRMIGRVAEWTHQILRVVRPISVDLKEGGSQVRYTAIPRPGLKYQIRTSHGKFSLRTQYSWMLRVKNITRSQDRDADNIPPWSHGAYQSNCWGLLHRLDT